jgi:hypothetical protein
LNEVRRDGLPAVVKATQDEAVHLKPQGCQARERCGARFDTQKIEAVALQFSKFWKRHDLCRAGAGEWNNDLFEETSRPWTHDENAIGQE